MKYYESVLGPGGPHAARPSEPAGRRLHGDGAGEDGAAQPRRLGQGPDGGQHGREGGRCGPARSGRHPGGEHFRQHRARPRDDRGGERIPLHFHDAGQDERGKDRHAQGLRGGGRRHQGRTAPRPPRELRGGRETHRRGDAEELLHRPVLQHEQPRGPLPDHGARNLGRHRRADRLPGGRHRNRRNDFRRRQLPEGKGGGGGAGAAYRLPGPGRQHLSRCLLHRNRARARRLSGRGNRTRLHGRHSRSVGDRRSPEHRRSGLLPDRPATRPGGRNLLRGFDRNRGLRRPRGRARARPGQARRGHPVRLRRPLSQQVLQRRVDEGHGLPRPRAASRHGARGARIQGRRGGVRGNGRDTRPRRQAHVRISGFRRCR